MANVLLRAGALLRAEQPTIGTCLSGEVLE